MPGFMGKDGFAWFFGVVEDRMDPLEAGRVRVRIFGYHEENKTKLPTKALPWATPIQPVTSPAVSGKGFSAVGLLEGTWVLGFFADPGSYQVPVILGALSGVNSLTIKELNENYGSGFQDIRTPEELKNYPVDEVSRTYPNGLSVEGDKHGAQIQNAASSLPFPRQIYGPKSSGRKQGTPDLNILAINDEKRIEKTIVDLKTKTREEGGLRDTNVPVANIFFPKFVTGVIGLTGVNVGTNKALGIPPNFVMSSSVSSMKNTYSQYKARPTNANAEKIHTGISPLNTLKATTDSVVSFRNTLSNGINSMDNVKNKVNSITTGTVVTDKVSGITQ
jgi:hypothetical protein